MNATTFLEVEIQLGRGRVRLVCPHRQEYVDEARVDDTLCQRLLELEHAKNYQAYGQTLFEATFPIGSETLRGLYIAFDSSRKEKQCLRVRLNLEHGTDPRIHALHWELLTDGRDFEIGRSPETVFSRYVSQPSVVGRAPAKARMLCVIAAPTDSHRYQMAPIDYHLTVRSFEECLIHLKNDLEVEILERPVTAERLRDALQHGGFNFLHFHGHGAVPQQGESALVLEDDNYRVHFTTESALSNILLGLRDLKLVTLVTCHGAAQSSNEYQHSGLAGSLVKTQIPAVVAMRRSISMDVGYKFTKYLYQQLAERPCIDSAVNEARHRLFMENPEGIDWSSPILFMRLEDGLLWSPAESALEAPSSPEPSRVTKRGRSGNAALRRPLSLLLVLLLTIVLSFPDLYLGLSRASVSKHDLPRESASKQELETEEPPSPEIAFPAIQAGTIGVGALKRQDLSWNGSVARIISRRLRELRPGLQMRLLPQDFSGNLGAFFSGDLRKLPGGERSPEGLEYIFLVVESHGPLTSATAQFPTVSVNCELMLIETRGPSILLSLAISHTGMETTEAGALDQAFGRCIDEDSLSEFL